MNNPNWNKHTETAAERRDGTAVFGGIATAKPVSEAELEAFRYRGTPIRRQVPPAVPAAPPAPHPGHTPAVAPGGHN